MFHHGIQHLCCCDNLFSCFVYFFDQDFLNNRNILHRNLNTHVTTGYHDTVGYADDLINVIHTLFVLNFCNDIDALAVMLIQNFTDLENIICGSCKGSCDKIKAIFNTKHDIVIICLTDKRHGQLYIRYIDTFFIGNHTTIYNFTHNIGSIQTNDFHLDQTVINQNTIANVHITMQIFVSNGNAACIAHEITKCQGKKLSFFQFCFATFQLF